MAITFYTASVHYYTTHSHVEIKLLNNLLIIVVNNNYATQDINTSVLSMSMSAVYSYKVMSTWSLG